MIDRPLTFGIVGAGRMAQSYVQAFQHVTSASLAAIADSRADAAQVLAEVAGCQGYGTYQAMMEATPLDAVIICTPPVTHAEIGCFFLQHAVHVLCEKPLCLDVDTAIRLTDTAQRAGVHLTMASKFRYVEDVIQAKRLVTSGQLGDLVFFENAFTTYVDMTSRWNADPTISGGGVLIDNGPHAVDLMRYFLGPLAEVHTVEGTRPQGLGVEETVRVWARSASGVMARSDLSWSREQASDRYLNLYGTQGTVAVGWRGLRYRPASGEPWHRVGDGYHKVQALRGQIENFSRAIHGEDRLCPTAEEAVASVAVLAAAYEALRQNQWVAVAPPPHALDGLPASRRAVAEVAA